MSGNVPNVYAAIVDVAGKIAASGIAKGRKNVQQGYQFRGIDDVYNALAPILASAHLCILPRITERSVTERQTKNGAALFYVTVRAEFDFVSSLDGSKHTVVTYGEAMDSADKATNKAMSAAYKYAAMQAFCIPTEGDNDADAKTHEDIAPAPKPEPKPDDAEAQKRKRRLEAEIGQAAKAEGLDDKALREKVKAGCKAKFSVEHFIELSPAQFDFALNKILPAAVLRLVDERLSKEEQAA